MVRGKFQSASRVLAGFVITATGGKLGHNSETLAAKALGFEFRIKPRGFRLRRLSCAQAGYSQLQVADVAATVPDQTHAGSQSPTPAQVLRLLGTLTSGSSKPRFS